MTKDALILLKIYKKVYAETDPPADFRKLMDSGETKKEGWFMNYTLSEERQKEILETTLKEFKIPKWKKKAFRVEYWLGCSPKSS